MQKCFLLCTHPNLISCVILSYIHTDYQQTQQQTQISSSSFPLMHTSTVQLSDKLHIFHSWTVYCTLPIIEMVARVTWWCYVSTQ